MSRTFRQNDRERMTVLTEQTLTPLSEREVRKDEEKQKQW